MAFRLALTLLAACDGLTTSPSAPGSMGDALSDVASDAGDRDGAFIPFNSDEDCPIG